MELDSVSVNLIAYDVGNSPTRDAKCVLVDDSAADMSSSASFDNITCLWTNFTTRFDCSDLTRKNNITFPKGAGRLVSERNQGLFAWVNNNVTQGRPNNNRRRITMILDRPDEVSRNVPFCFFDISTRKRNISAKLPVSGILIYLDRLACDVSHGTGFTKSFKNEGNTTCAYDNSNNADPQNRISPTRHVELSLKVCFGVLLIVVGIYALSQTRQARRQRLDGAAYLFSAGVTSILVGSGTLYISILHIVLR